MRGCLLVLLLVVLLAATAYLYYQVITLRAEVTRLRQQVAALQPAPPHQESLSDLVAAAQEALRRHDLPRAQQELDRFLAQVARARTMAAGEKAKLTRLAAQAKHALAKRQAAAAQSLERLLDGLGPDKATQRPAGK